MNNECGLLEMSENWIIVKERMEVNGNDGNDGNEVGNEAHYLLSNSPQSPFS